MEKFRKEMEENGKQVNDSNQMKLDYIWGQLIIMVSYLLKYLSY
jgi:hypothetical protein